MAIDPTIRRKPRGQVGGMDAAYNVALNPVTLPDGTVVPWGAAFARLSDEGMAAVRAKRKEAGKC